MSDDERTPLKTARVNSERFDTELAAVWYAANYYYEASYRRRAEYCGIVFRERNGKIGITVRSDGDSAHASVIPDVPAGSTPIAVWHTHLPASVSGNHPATNYLFSLFYKAMTGSSMDEEFSPADLGLTPQSWVHKFKQKIPIYLVTATVIKRHGVNSKMNGVWSKEPPSHMRSAKH